MLPTKFEKLRERTKERLETSPYGYQAGELESLRIRIDALEDALAHLMAWTAERFRLTEEEIEGEDGIADF